MYPERIGCRGTARRPRLAFDYWYAGTRIIPFTINEFPFFTFLFADLHPHLMALPFGLLVLVLCGLFIQSRQNARTRLVQLAIALVLTLGMLGVTNTWDLPVYLLIASATLIYVGYRRSALRGRCSALGWHWALGWQLCWPMRHSMLVFARRTCDWNASCPEIERP